MRQPNGICHGYCFAACWPPLLGWSYAEWFVKGSWI